MTSAIPFQDSLGSAYLDTLEGIFFESSVKENAVKVYNSFSPSTKLGEVLVVPNPYRGSEHLLMA